MDDTLTLRNVELSDIHDKPELITSLLYKKLLEKLDAAIMLLPQRRYMEFNRALQLCNDILTRLGSGLKYEAGIMADHLEMLYRYMYERIYEANLQKDAEPLREVRRLIRELDAAWTVAMKKVLEEKAIKDEGDGIQQASFAGISSRSAVKLPVSRVNPYQQREIEQEFYKYEKEKQEIHIKK